MKKVLSLIGVLLMLSGSVFASQDRQQIMDETMSISNTTATADASIEDADRVSFFINYDSDGGTDVTVRATIAYSYDGGENWVDARFLDFAGGSTFQTSEGLFMDGTHFFWLDDEPTVPLVRIRATLDESVRSGLGEGDTADFDVYIVRDN